MRDQLVPIAPASDNRALINSANLASLRRTLPSPASTHKVEDRRSKIRIRSSMRSTEEASSSKIAGDESAKEQERDLAGSANIQGYPQGSYPCASIGAKRAARPIVLTPRGRLLRFPLRWRRATIARPRADENTSRRLFFLLPREGKWVTAALSPSAEAGPSNISA